MNKQLLMSVLAKNGHKQGDLAKLLCLSLSRTNAKINEIGGQCRWDNFSRQSAETWRLRSSMQIISRIAERCVFLCRMTSGANLKGQRFSRS